MTTLLEKVSQVGAGLKQSMGDMWHDLTTSYPPGQLQTAYARREINKLIEGLRSGEIPIVEEVPADLSQENFPNRR